MNKLYKRTFKELMFFICFTVIGAYGQEHIKSYKENFNVNNNTVLDIDINHSDIQFKTWDKDEVEVEATIEVSGVAKEDLAMYFKENPITILGNSKVISIRTDNPHIWTNGHSIFNLKDLNIELPGILALPELPPMPPLPPLSITVFDYERYKKEGDAYLKKWQLDFEENLDEVYQEKIEDWSKKVEEEHNRIENLHEQTKSIMMKKGLEIQEKLKGNEVKRVIKIKMPKSLKIKMNVRHGNVKLAKNTKNLDATLSYSGLDAFNIDGEKTIIVASYSPVTVQKWNYGKLQADYSEKVNLLEVRNLILDTTSSDVTIGYLIDSAFIENKFGPLYINSISNNFSDLEVSLQNVEFKCNMPSTPYSIVVNGSDSMLKAPPCINLSKTKSIGNTKVYKGYYINNDSERSIIINSKYSEVALD